MGNGDFLSAPISRTSATALFKRLFAIAMLIMAFDEQFMLHEHWKYHCMEWTDACSIQWVRELPMIMVALGGSATGILLHRCLSQKLARGFLCGSLLPSVYLHSISALYRNQRHCFPAKAALLVLAEALFIGLFSLPPDHFHDRSFKCTRHTSLVQRDTKPFDIDDEQKLTRRWPCNFWFPHMSHCTKSTMPSLSRSTS